MVEVCGAGEADEIFGGGDSSARVARGCEDIDLGGGIGDEIFHVIGHDEMIGHVMVGGAESSFAKVNGIGEIFGSVEDLGGEAIDVGDAGCDEGIFGGGIEGASGIFVEP